MIIIKIQAGLGNQLFQYAIGKALSVQLNTELKLDLSFYNDANNKNAYRLNRFNIIANKAELAEYEKLKNHTNIPMPIRILKKAGIRIYPYYRKTHLIEDNVYELFKEKQNHTNNYYIEGWFANEKHFNMIRHKIITDFNADFLLNTENKRIQKEIQNSNSVSVHIRRGDYLTNTYFKTLPLEYYIKAIEKTKQEIKEPVFYFFSNDIEWTKQKFSHLKNSHFIEKNSIPDTSYTTTGDIEDLMLMRTCKHNIIANSTFSWWGGWLNENPAKQVYFPAYWYNNIKAQKLFEKNSFIPNEWIKVQF